jgi:hypothetical protein
MPARAARNIVWRAPFNQCKTKDKHHVDEI